MASVAVSVPKGKCHKPGSHATGTQPHVTGDAAESQADARHLGRH